MLGNSVDVGWSALSPIGPESMNILNTESVLDWRGGEKGPGSTLNLDVFRSWTGMEPADEERETEASTIVKI